MALDLEKKKAYIKQALKHIEFGDDEISFYLKIIASSMLAYHLVRIYNLVPALGCSLVDCDCPDHVYRQSFCKHMVVAFMYFLELEDPEADLPIWQVSKAITTQLRQLRILDKVRIRHLTNESMTIGLIDDPCPIPRWRVSTLADWAHVLPELLVELDKQQLDVA